MTLTSQRCRPRWPCATSHEQPRTVSASRLLRNKSTGRCAMHTCRIFVFASLLLGCGSDSTPGLAMCGQSTVNLFDDPQHCGNCETACGGATAACVGGVCVA